MNPRPPLPLDLKLVLGLLLLYGSLALAVDLWNLFHSKVQFDIAWLGIPAAIGLGQRSNGWRMFTLVALGLVLLGFAALAGLYLFSHDFLDPEPVQIAGHVISYSKRVVAAVMIVFIAVPAWMLRVLMRPDVRTLFRSNEPIRS